MRRLVVAAKYALALTLLAWLAWSGRLDVGALASVRRPSLHAVGILLIVGVVLLQSLRWWRLLTLQGIGLPFTRVLRANWIGYFYALLLPGVGGGDVVRGLYILRDAGGARLKATSSVLLDRAIGVYASLWLAMIAVVHAGSWPGAEAVALTSIRLAVVALLALCSAAVALLLWPRSRSLVYRLPIGRWRAVLKEALDGYAARPRSLALCFLLSLGSSASFLAAFWVAGRALPVELSAMQVLLVVPLVLIVNALPLSPGGFGVGETAAAVLFSACGIDNGATLMFTVRLWQALVRIPGLVLQVTGAGAHRSGQAAVPTPESRTRAVDPPG